jgi:hypothetical protein
LSDRDNLLAELSRMNVVNVLNLLRDIGKFIGRAKAGAAVSAVVDEDGCVTCEHIVRVGVGDGEVAHPLEACDNGVFVKSPVSLDVPDSSANTAG